jgi:hypothetical protein
MDPVGTSRPAWAAEVELCDFKLSGPGADDFEFNLLETLEGERGPQALLDPPGQPAYGDSGQDDHEEYQDER